MKWLLYSSVSVLAFATAAAAQEAASSAKSEQGGIAEIVVTASRRVENIQKAALSIQALSSEALSRANVTKPEDLNSIAPGVQIANSGVYSQVYIRGVGTYGTQAYAEQAVAFNIDGVYISRPWAPRGMFYDLDRVEVLKGPQGTLYGRNATGGAINLITARPKLGENGGFAEVQVGNYNLREGTAAVNVAVGDTVAVRASGQIVKRDGYTGTYNDDDMQSGRLQVLVQPSDNLSVRLYGGGMHIGGKGAIAVVPSAGNPFRPYNDPSVIAIIRAQPGTGPALVAPGENGFTNAHSYSLGAEVNWNLNFATLTFIPAYRSSTLRELQYSPGFGVRDNERDKQVSVETRLGNDGEKLKWVLGGFYYNEEQSNLPGAAIQDVIQGITGQSTRNFRLRTRSYAMFGQATYSLTDRLRLTGGLRYTKERKLLDGVLARWGAPTGGTTCAAGFVYDPTSDQPPLLCRGDVPLSGRLAFKNVTYKAGVEFDLAPQSMAYANVSTGFKSGGFYSAPPPNTFKPEKLTAFEAGLKNRFLDNRLQVNVDGFYWRYTDQQVSYTSNTSVPGFLTNITANAQKASIYGGDLDVLFRATPADELSMKVQYVRAKYDNYQYSNFGIPVTGCALVGAFTGGVQRVDCSGKPLYRTAPWSGLVGYSHTFDLGTSGTLTASADALFGTGYFLSIDYRQDAYQNAYIVGDIDLTYVPPGERVSISAYVRNISNELVRDRATRYPFVSGANPLAPSRDGLYAIGFRPPRTIGGRVRVNF